MGHQFYKTILGIILLITIPLQAQKVFTVDNVPNPKDTDGGWVSDPNNYLKPEEVLELNRLITEIENTSTAQIAVVILPSIGTEVPKDFATTLFNKWGIGQAQKDNGLLILTVIDQRRTEFETGYGMEAILTDALSYRIASQELVPYFKNGEYGLGLIAGVKRIKELLDNPEAVNELYDSGGVAYTPATNPIIYILGFYGLFMLFALYHYIINVRKIDKNKEDFYDKFQDLYNIKHFLYIIFFPIPFLLIRFLFIKRRLNKYRNHPRFSKKNGKKMFKKSEVTEDPFLKKGQLVEEKIHSVDYDVWVTEDNDDVLVLKYKSLFSKYSKCPECNYQTYYRAHSKIVKSATKTSTGVREETYKCKNCDYHKVKRITIPKITTTGSSSSGSSSYGGGSGFGGSSSFGGGSSGGGGAGVSW
jgi:uncharacterized protein